MRVDRIIWIVYLILLVNAVSAAPINPEEYWGYVYIGDDLASSNNILGAYTTSGELIVSQQIPVDANYKGSYHIFINFDDPNTEKDEGTINGEEIIWKLNNLTVNIPSSDKAEVGKVNDNFIIKAIINPKISLNLDYDKNIKLGEKINIITTYNNTAEGTGKIVLKEKENKFLKNSENEFEYQIEPTTCGEYIEDLNYSIYNANGEIFETITKEIKTNVQGQDIGIDVLNIEKKSTLQDENNLITATVKNYGNKNIEKYSVEFSTESEENKQIIQKVNVDTTLGPRESIPITINWDAKKEGNYILKAEIIYDDLECNKLNNIASKEIEVIGRKVKVKSGTITSDPINYSITGKTITQSETKYIEYEDGSFNISKKVFWGILIILTVGIIGNLYLRRNYVFTIERNPEPEKQKIKIIHQKDNSFEEFNNKINNFRNEKVGKSSYTLINKTNDVIENSIKNKASLVPYKDIKEVELLIQLIQKDKNLRTEILLNKYSELGYQPHIIHYSLNAVRQVKHKSPLKFDLEKKYRRLGVYPGMKNITKGQLQKIALILAEQYKK